MSSSTQKVEKLKTKAFWIAFEMVFIFGLPAAAAIFLSKWLGWGSTAMYISLAAAFVLSWVIVVIRVRKLSEEMRQAKEAEENHKSDD